MGENPKKRHGIRKPRLHFIPPVALIEEAIVMENGARKYGAYNWTKNPVDASTYYDAIQRHLLAWFTGEDNDAESGASHLAHVRACCGILMDNTAMGALIDDRPAKTAPAAAAIKKFSK